MARLDQYKADARECILLFSYILVMIMIIIIVILLLIEDRPAWIDFCSIAHSISLVP